MKAFRVGLLLSLVLLLTGCVQAQVSSLKSKCDFSQDPRFAILRGKVPLTFVENSVQPSVRQIDDRSKPTPDEREALLVLDDLRTACRREAMTIINKHGTADIAGLYQETSLAQTNQMRLLVNGQITFGQYNNNTYQIGAQSLRAFGQIERAQRSANAAAQQAAAAQLSATMQALQTFNREPTTTTCNRLGSSISCTSY